MLVWLFIISLILQLAWSYKMAFFVLDVSNSQLLFNERLAEPLTAAGHDVTLILMAPQSDRDRSDVKIEGNIKVYTVNASTGVTQKDLDDKDEALVYQEMPGYKMLERLKMQTKLLTDACQVTIKQKTFIDWLKAEKFDLAFAPMFDVCSVGLIHEANFPGWIWLNSGTIMDYIANLIGVPTIPSYVPPMMMEAGAEMTFVQRIKSVIGHGLTSLIWKKFVAEPETQLFRKFVSPGFPDLLELATNCPLIMANTNDLYELPRPTLAKVVNIGGVGMDTKTKTSKPLPKNILDILDDSDGTVLFSFGSVAPMWKMPLSWKKMFLATFERFPRYKFLLRYEKDDINDILPSNVHLFKWMPQSDLLRHPKTKAFITHGGYNSFQEAVLAGVPCITIPLFGDQSKNALLAEHHGFSLVVRKRELCEEVVYNALKEVITNSSYKEAATRLSRMVAHQPVRPTESLVRWSEFVAEFQTLENLQPAGTKLGFIQYHSFDVIGFLLAIVLAVVMIVAKTLLFMLRRLRSILSQPQKKKVA